MPTTVRKVGRGRYSVRTPSGTKAKSTTKKKAESQQRLLNAIEHNPDFKPRRKKPSK